MTRTITTCPNCGSHIEAGHIRCPVCAKRITAPAYHDIDTEPPAEQERPADWDELMGMISSQPPETAAPDVPVSGKSWGVMMKMTVFFGFFGVHRLYAGKIWTGILWMLTFGLFLVGWIADMVLVYSGNFKDKNGAYIRKNKPNSFGGLLRGF